MVPLILCLLLCAPLAAQTDPDVHARTFSPAEFPDQPVALAVDDAGRVFLSCTERACGRGVEDITENEKLRREDAAVFSLDDRRAAVGRWIKDGSVKAAPAGVAERVVCLMEPDHDGRAKQRLVVAGDFGDTLDGPAGGILTLTDGAVLFGCTPSLWRLEDDNSDHRADRRLPLLTGFGIRQGNGLPGIRAMTEGPDGLLYFTTGDRGSRVTSLEGDRFVLEGTGGVWRCRQDGAELELLATGLRDPAGIAVDLRGRIFVADTAPGSETTRLLLVQPGADFAVAAPGLEIATLPGRAGGFIIAEELRDTASLPSFLMTDSRNAGAVIPVTLQEQGGTLSAAAGAPVWQGAPAGGLAFAPDGAVLWCEWSQGFRAVSRVSVLRLPPRGNGREWSEGAALLAAGIASLNADDLPPLLEHPHPLVRRRAGHYLTRLGYQESLDLFARTAKRSPTLSARLNAVWGLAALARTTPMLINEVQLLLTSAEPDIRALAVHIIGETGGSVSAQQEVLPLLRDPSPAVRTEAAIALGRLRPAGLTEEIAIAIHECGDTQPALHQALTFALTELSTPAALAARGTATASPYVKSAALAALIRLRAVEVADFLGDESPEIAAAAARAIYDGRILPAFPLLAAALGQCAARPTLVQPDFIRRALAAALRTGTEEAAAAVAAFAALPDDKIPAALRAAARDTLTNWGDPPLCEPVHGRYDFPLPRLPGIARDYLVRLKPETSKPKPGAAALIASISDPKRSVFIRGEALSQLASVQPPKALELARSLLPGKGPATLLAVARTTIMRLDAASAYTQIQETLAAGSPQEKQAVLTFAQRFDSKLSDAFWKEMGKRFIEGKLDPSVRVEVWESLQQRDVATRGPYRRLLEAADAALDEAADPLARWLMCEEGGDAAKGRRVFETNRTLNCTACHSLQGRGGVSGPELDHVAARLTRKQLLASLVQPSAAIAPGFGEVTVTLRDGVALSGILRRRDDAALLFSTPHGHRRIQADEVKSLSPPVSPMPSVSTLLTPREIRDLMAWLETLK